MKYSYPEALLEAQSVSMECPKIIECQDCVFSEIRREIPRWKRRIWLQYVDKEELVTIVNKHLACLDNRDEEDYS